MSVGAREVQWDSVRVRDARTVIPVQLRPRTWVLEPACAASMVLHYGRFGELGRGIDQQLRDAAQCLTPAPWMANPPQASRTLHRSGNGGTSRRTTSLRGIGVQGPGLPRLWDEADTAMASDAAMSNSYTPSSGPSAPGVMSR